MDALAFQAVVVLQPVRVDQRDIALSILGDDLLAGRLGLLGQLGEVGACLREAHHIAGGKRHGRLTRVLQPGEI